MVFILGVPANLVNTERIDSTICPEIESVSNDMDILNLISNMRYVLGVLAFYSDSSLGVNTRLCQSSPGQQPRARNPGDIHRRRSR